MSFLPASFWSSARTRRPTVRLALLILVGALLLPAAGQASAPAVQTPPTPQPPLSGAPLTGGEAKPKLENGAPVDVRRVLPAPVVLSADALDTPVITVWHGDGDAFGQNGKPSPFINILGNVQPVGAITSLTYALNGGAAQALNLGPYAGEPDEGGARRVYDPGDFNIEIPFSALNSGTNSVRIQATQSDTTMIEKTVTVEVTKGKRWPLPTVVNWGEATSVNQVAQVIDGHWTIEGTSAVGPSVRSIQFGYDRLVGLGDLNWPDYEVTVPIVVNAISDADAAFALPSNGPGVGLIMRWPGHYQVTTEDPYNGWTELGSLAWFHYLNINSQTSTAMQMLTTRDGFQILENTTKTLGNDQPTYFKMQVVTSGVRPTYRFKTWPIGQAEPASWDLEKTLSANTPSSGSLLLVAHHVDANFGQVRVTPINYRANLTINSAVGGTAAAVPAQSDYAFYDEVTVNAEPAAGYALLNWDISVTKATGEVTAYTSSANPLVINIAGDTTITPIFQEGAFAVDVQKVGEGEVTKTPDQSFYTLGEQVALNAQPAAGWRFDRWQGSVTGTSPNVTLTVAGPESVTATFEREYYTITSSAVDTTGVAAATAGTITLAPPSSTEGYVYGEDVTLLATANAGWEFVRWQGAATGESPATVVRIEGDTNVQAVFQRQQLSLATARVGNGRVTVSRPGPYEFGTTVTIEALADGGWIFSQWEGDVPADERDSAQVELTMTDNLSVTAVFVEVRSDYFLPLIRRQR